MDYSHKPKAVKTPVTCIEIVNAIQDLISLEIRNRELNNANAIPEYGEPKIVRDEIEARRRIIADGLRYHSGGAGVYGGEE